jgi:hypothetical protein
MTVPLTPSPTLACSPAVGWGAVKWNAGSNEWLGSRCRQRASQSAGRRAVHLEAGGPCQATCGAASLRALQHPAAAPRRRALPPHLLGHFCKCD